MFTIFYRVFTLLKKRKKLTFLLTLANLVFAILVLIEPIFFREIIDTLIAFNASHTWEENKDVLGVLFFWLILWFFLIIIRLFISIFADRLWHEEFNKVILWLFDHILELSIRFHTNSNSGEMVKKLIRWSDCIFYSQLDLLRRIFPDIFTMLILIPLIIFLNWKLGLFVTFFWFISAFVAVYSISKTFTQQDKIEKYYNQSSALYADTFSNIFAIKSFTLSGMKKRELTDILDKRLEKQYPILNWWGFLMSFSKIVNIIISIGVIFFGSYLFFRWEATIGEIVMFLSFSSIFLASIENSMWSIESLFWRMAPIKDYFKILDEGVEIQDIENPKILKKVRWEVEFQNLWFSYDGKRKVLEDINLHVQPWEKIAFVGHTGSGKTTMTNMLLRFFEPQQGKILIDGEDISKVTQESLRKNIWVVFQESSMFNTTILKNIQLDNTQATRKEIEKVASQSHTSEFIKRLSDWLDTIVGERWVKLSGGEKQRLAIARAFLKNAPILILDEATSALDAETEKYLQDSFEELMKWRTTFIIAHRLSTIRKADRIFVFENGQIVEQGNYSTLKKKGGHFTKLVNAQTEGFLD